MDQMKDWMQGWMMKLMIDCTMVRYIRWTEFMVSQDRMMMFLSYNPHDGAAVRLNNGLIVGLYDEATVRHDDSIFSRIMDTQTAWSLRLDMMQNNNNL